MTPMPTNVFLPQICFTLRHRCNAATSAYENALPTPSPPVRNKVNNVPSDARFFINETVLGPHIILILPRCPFVNASNAIDAIGVKLLFRNIRGNAQSTHGAVTTLHANKKGTISMRLIAQVITVTPFGAFLGK